ncbi:MAG: transcription antitermination factor NusB [Phycisphaerales bacterium]
MSRTSAKSVQTPRDAAFRYLSRQAERMPELGLFDVQTGAMDARDSALAHAIVDGAVTRWLTLDFIISGLAGRQLRDQEPRMQAVLLGGAVQLLLMDRIPPHAAIDEAVEWAKTNIRPGAGGMTNAILRKVAVAKGAKTEGWNHHLDSIPLSDGKALMIKGMELPANGRHRLSIACSISGEMLQRWENHYGDPTSQAMHTLCKSPTVLNVEYAQEALDDSILLAHDSPTHRVYTGGRADLIGLLESRQDIWVQDSASSHVVEDIDLAEPPELVVDLCAGKGTKTRQLRERFPQSKIVAGDVDEKQLGILYSVFASDDRVRAVHVDVALDEYAGQADLVLTDVPCTNSGVLARRREARYRPMKKQLARILPLQKHIVKNALGLLKPKGTLVYSTCSVEPDENELQTQWIRDKLGLHLVQEHRLDPIGQPGDHWSHYRDGSYSAQFVRTEAQGAGH